MTDQLPDLITGAQSFDRRRWPDVIRTGFLVLSEAIPGLNTLFEEFLPNYRAERVRDFLIDVAESIKRLEDRFDVHEAGTVDYGCLVEHVARQVAQTSGEEKLAAYRAILLNTCIPSPPDKLERAYFLDLLNRLQEVHVVLISLFRDQYAFGKAHGSGPSRGVMDGSLSDTIAAYLKPLGLDDELTRCAIRDLDTMGILPGLYDLLDGAICGSGDLSSRLRDFGRRFADFIALPPDVAITK